ncbi:MAG: hypothetical protein CSA09_02430 [Candidatus Contendobacter odensis]|uniref:Murein endopeptidase K n=1 Tax=Candidatus Contendibacter odensensis TaxID=1400860 RepID=A0A2G6PFL8_9GAMM|nr:MAG: hypothetical protein CSA09_02430 [Candidatus Contendobacter odensis]
MRADKVFQPDSMSGEDRPVLERRGFLKLAMGGVSALALAPGLTQGTVFQDRRIQFYNTHTGEAVSKVYWTPRDGYVRESISEISWSLRDHHNNKVMLFDPNVLDQLYALQTQFGLSQPMHIVSAYRSPSTNRKLRARNRKVARNSFHMKAMALDIRIPNRRVSELYRAARSLGAGGVGYYPRSNFIHIDSGPIRYWS